VQHVLPLSVPLEVLQRVQLLVLTLYQERELIHRLLQRLHTDAVVLDALTVIAQTAYQYLLSKGDVVLVQLREVVLQAVDVLEHVVRPDDRIRALEET